MQTYESFSKYFGHIRRPGLVEFVREGLLDLRARRQCQPYVALLHYDEAGLASKPLARQFPCVARWVP